MALFEPKFERSSDSLGFSKRIPWTDRQCIILCLENCINMAGQDKNQVERIIKTLMEPRKYFPNRLLNDNFDPNSVVCSIDDVEVDCADLGDEYPAL